MSLAIRTTIVPVIKGLMNKNQNQARKNFSLRVVLGLGSVSSVEGRRDVKIKTATMLRTSRVLIRAARILHWLDTVK